jgi:hypothetical protein
MGFTPNDVEKALSAIESLLGVTIDPELQVRYESGREMYALSYDKLQQSTGLPVLNRYIIAARSYLHQPCAYYDIFRACRATIYVQLLATALEHLSEANIKGLDARLDRLRRATNYDVFDSVLFELATAWRYSVEVPKSEVVFMAESAGVKTPDFSYNLLGTFCYCECKKLNRSDVHSVKIRNAARDCLNPVITKLRAEQVSATAELIFHEDPHDVASAKVSAALRDALSNDTPILEKEFTISAQPLAPYRSDTYALYPSPGFYWDRYRYRHRSEWMGIVHQIHGEFVQPSGAPLNDKIPFSTWLSEISWDAAIKWNISNEKIIAKYRRFAFDGVFEALAQVETQPINSTAHIWLESDYYLDGRENTLKDLFQRIQRNARDIFGWLTINETLLDVSPKGHFDIIEHSHIIEGPTAISATAPVTLIITRKSTNLAHTSGEFGKGTSLPDIDA